MKKSRFTDSQIMSVLKQLEAGVTVAELSREHNVSTATLYQWRAKYGGMDTSMIKRLKELEAENARLKKMYAEERIKAEIRKDALEGKL
jgi:putative transposase